MKFAAIANAGTSHQMSMCAIGRELQKRGHDFMLLGTDFQATQLKLPDIRFERLNDALTNPAQPDPAKRYFDCAMREGEVPISATVEYMKQMAALLCSHAPAVLNRNNIDFVLADQEEPGAATASELAALPYASICSSLPLNDASDVPPGFLAWPYSSGVFARLRNRLGYTVRDLAVRGVHQALNTFRRPAGLRPYRKPDDSFSSLAQITQLVKEFDFPRQAPPAALRYVGPFQRQALSAVDFPFERLDGRPLVYASFGTTFGSRSADLRAIAESCAALPVQLVISLGGFEPSAEHDAFPGTVIIVRYAPQRELLSRAALAITHAGLNTALEALSLGVPLLALPIAGDQLGVSARISYHRVGITLGKRERSVEQLRAAISSLLNDPQWRQAAKNLQQAICRSSGAAEAAGIIENIAYDKVQSHC